MQISVLEMQIYVFNLEIKISVFQIQVSAFASGKHIILTHLNPSFIYTERKKKRRVNFIPKFHSSLKKFVKYFTMITIRYMCGTKVPNFIGL